MAQGFMYAYLERTPDKAKTIFKFDLPFILRLIRDHFKKSSFVHCYIVQDIINWFSQAWVKHASFPKLKVQFQNEIYRVYTLLIYDRLRARYDHDYKYGFDEYNKLKDKEIRQSFQFKNLQEFRKFYKIFLYLSEWGIKPKRKF
jgi:hypothetical protein